MLEGPTAIAFIEADGDMVAVAKALADSARTTKILAIRGGILDGSPIGEEDVKNLATLPPIDVLRSQVLGAITAPLMTVVGLISAPVRDLIGLVDARIEQLAGAGRHDCQRAPGGGGRGRGAPEEPTAEAAAEEPPAERRPPSRDRLKSPSPQSRRQKRQYHDETPTTDPAISRGCDRAAERGGIVAATASTSCSTSSGR